MIFSKLVWSLILSFDYSFAYCESYHNNNCFAFFVKTSETCTAQQSNCLSFAIVL